MNNELFNEYTQFVKEGFSTFLPILILFVSVSLTFAIANSLVFFIRKTVKNR